MLSAERLEIVTSSPNWLRLLFATPFLLGGTVLFSVGLLRWPPVWILLTSGGAMATISLMVLRDRSSFSFNRERGTLEIRNGFGARGKVESLPCDQFHRVTLEIIGEGSPGSWLVRLEGKNDRRKLAVLNQYAKARELAACVGKFLGFDLDDRQAREIRSASAMRLPTEFPAVARRCRRSAPPLQFSLANLMAATVILASFFALGRQLDPHGRMGLVSFPAFGAFLGLLGGAMYGASVSRSFRHMASWIAHASLVGAFAYLVIGLLLIGMMQSTEPANWRQVFLPIATLPVSLAMVGGLAWRAYRRRIAAVRALETRHSTTLPGGYTSLLVQGTLPMAGPQQVPWFGLPDWYLRDVDTGICWLLAAIPKPSLPKNVLTLDSNYAIPGEPPSRPEIAVAGAAL